VTPTISTTDWVRPQRTQSVVEIVGVTFTPRSVVDDRWQEGFSFLVRTFLQVHPHFSFGRSKDKSKT
jgi:hypothetical protein